MIEGNSSSVIQLAINIQTALNKQFPKIINNYVSFLKTPNRGLGKDDDPSSPSTINLQETTIFQSPHEKQHLGHFLWAIPVHSLSEEELESIHSPALHSIIVIGSKHRGAVFSFFPPDVLKFHLHSKDLQECSCNVLF